MKLLIVYGADEGQTVTICRFLKKEAEKNNHNVTLIEISKSLHNPESFDAIIIGAPFMEGNYHPTVLDYLQNKNRILNNIPGIFLAVGLTSETIESDVNKKNRFINDFLTQSGWHPDHIEYVANADEVEIPSPPSRISRGKYSKQEEHSFRQQVKDILEKLEHRIEKAKSESGNPALYSHSGN